MLRGTAALLCTLTAASAASVTSSDIGLWTALPWSAPPTGATAAHPLPFLYDLYTFRGSARSTVVVAAFAVASGDLRKEPAGSEIRHRFDVTLVLADTALGRVFRTDDSVFVRMPRRLDGEHLLYTHVEVQAPPSGSTVQRVIMTDATTPGIGQLYSSEFPIPDYHGSHLMLSDIALAQPGADVGWRRGDVTLALLPTGQFPESSFDVYYEIYNLTAGHPYATEIAVERVDRKGSPVQGTTPVRVRYTGESMADSDGLVPELRHVDASVGRGRYRITVAITDQRTGQSASRSRLFEVRGWVPGATLVPALPREGGRSWAQRR